MTRDIYLNSYLSKEQNDALLEDHSNLIVLTPDDILTLKLLRDDYAKELVGSYSRSYRSYELALETLERILKQVG
jgi:hypothetical protein